MLVIVSEFLLAHSTDYMCWPWFWLFKHWWSLLLRCQFRLLLLHILLILIVQKSAILVCKFSLFLKLEDRGAERSINVGVMDVVLANIDPWAQVHFKLLLNLLSIGLEKMAVMGICVIILWHARTSHKSCLCSWYTERNAESLHFCLPCLPLSLEMVELHHLVDCDGFALDAGASIHVKSKASFNMPFDSLT